MCFYSRKNSITTISKINKKLFITKRNKFGKATFSLSKKTYPNLAVLKKEDMKDDFELQEWLKYHRAEFKIPKNNLEKMYLLKQIYPSSLEIEENDSGQYIASSPQKLESGNLTLNESPKSKYLTTPTRSKYQEENSSSRELTPNIKSYKQIHKKIKHHFPRKERTSRLERKKNKKSNSFSSRLSRQISVDFSENIKRSSFFSKDLLIKLGTINQETIKILISLGIIESDIFIDFPQHSVSQEGSNIYSQLKELDRVTPKILYKTGILFSGPKTKNIEQILDLTFSQTSKQFKNFLYMISNKKKDSYAFEVETAFNTYSYLVGPLISSNDINCEEQRFRRLRLIGNVPILIFWVYRQPCFDYSLLKSNYVSFVLIVFEDEFGLLRLEMKNLKNIEICFYEENKILNLEDLAAVIKRIVVEASELLSPIIFSSTASEYKGLIPGFERRKNKIKRIFELQQKEGSKINMTDIAEIAFKMVSEKQDSK